MRKSSLGRACALLVVFAALSSAPTAADAAYEQAPEHFGASGEAAQLATALAVAVNERGVGGVEAGSFYVVGENGRVARYAPGKEGETPAFREAWGWGVGDPLVEEFQRCGPVYKEMEERSEPLPANTFATCTEPKQAGYADDEEPFRYGHFNTPAGVAVDQATGDVYVRNEPFNEHREHNLVEVFTATGMGIAHFGEAGRSSPPPAESIAEGPARLHEDFRGGGAVTVDEAGRVYLNDVDYGGTATPQQERVMSFVPETAGNYEHYVYAGQSHDIASGPTGNHYISGLALIGNDRLVAAREESIREYAVDPGSGESTLLCTFSVSGQLKAIAANSATGEVFYSAFSGRAIHRLSACDESTGKFEEIQAAVKPTPETSQLNGLAIDAALAWGEQRPNGVLYGVDGGNNSGSGDGDVFVPGKVGPPSVGAESVANTTSVSSTLRAQIEPYGVSTAFYFEYLTQAGYLADGESFEGQSVPVVAPVSPGEIGVAGLVSATVSGLVPDTEYHFRAVATRCDGTHEPACEGRGQVASFRTYPEVAAGLPDGRAYELVSPIEKNGGEVFPADPRIGSCNECKPPGGIAYVKTFPMQSTPDGNAVVYMGEPFAPSGGAAVANSYLSRRTASGWQTTVLSLPLMTTTGGQNLAFDDNLEAGTISQTGVTQLASEAPVDYPNIYLQNTADPAALSPLLSKRLFSTLSASGRPYRGTAAFTLAYAGHSADFSAQFVSVNDSLTEATPYAPQPPDPGQAGSDLYEWRGGQLSLVNVLPGNTAVAAGAAFVSASPDTDAVSADGKRVYWHVGSTLYVREDGRLTRDVRHAGSFLTASPDGLQVLFTDGCLYSLATETCTDLTLGEGGFQGIVGQSKDLSSIYFVDTAALAGSGKNTHGQEAQAGKDNLYFYSSGAQPRFVVTLASSDDAEKGEQTLLADWAAAPGERTAEASPDGRYLAFGSTEELTGYPNTGRCSGDQRELSEEACTEVFLYDSLTNGIICASCNPTGEAPRGFSTLRRIRFAEAWLPQPRYLTDQGRLFFDSQDRLSAGDTNGRVEDVYEYEPAGVGSCARAAGCVVLISPGTGSVDSNFLAMDETGANVFFTTRERLVPQDKDELIDLYDAREGGGFPSETETQRAECQGEACQSTPVPPTFSTPGSTTFSGLGTVFPATTTTPSTKQKVKKHVTTSAQKLARALQACRHKRVKRERAACERRARRQHRRVKASSYKANSHKGGKSHA